MLYATLSHQTILASLESTIRPARLLRLGIAQNLHRLSLILPICSKHVAPPHTTPLLLDQLLDRLGLVVEPGEVVGDEVTGEAEEDTMGIEGENRSSNFSEQTPLMSIGRMELTDSYTADTAQ